MKQDKIQIDTLPNGYSLSFKEGSYLYFNKQDLLEGFMYHVGLEEVNAVDRDLIKEFLSAAIVWKKEGGAPKEVIRLTKENEYLRSIIKALKQKLKKKKDGSNDNVTEEEVELEEKV